MEFRDELLTVAELAIGIAGFSAVVAAFSRQDRLHELDAGRFLTLVVIAASAVVLAFLPSLLHGSGYSGPALWRAASGLMVVFWVASMVPYAQQISRLRRADSEITPSIGTIAALTVPSVANLGLQVTNVSGSFWASGGAPYLFGTLVWLWAAGVLFVGIVIYRPDAEGPEP
jgi:hypothetical protein